MKKKTTENYEFAPCLKCNSLDRTKCGCTKKSEKDEAIEWWNKLKRKSGYLAISKKDKRFLQFIVSKYIDNMK